MGETDEFVPQSSNAEDGTAPELPADTAPDVAIDIAVETTSEVALEPALEADAAPDELDEIANSLSSEESAEFPADADAVAADADSDSFDNIAAPAPAAVPVSQVPEPTMAAGHVPWWPFLVYLGAWVVLAAAAVWQLLQLPAHQVVYESSAYVMTILGGLIMTAVGPLLILAVWLGTRANRSAQERAGLLTTALMKGAFVTLSGAIIWWASLVIIDYLRLGRLL